MLSREAMVAVINGGGSVLVNGRLVTRLENLPGVADLARTPDELAAAEAHIDSEMARLTEQKAKVSGKGKAGKEKEASGKDEK